MKARHNHNEYIIWKIKQWFVYLGYFFIDIFSTYIHTYIHYINCRTYNMISQNQTLGLMAMLEDLNIEITK